MVVKEMLPAVSKEFPDITVDAYCEEGAWSLEACVRLFEKAAKHHPLRVHADQFTSLGMVPEAIRLHARSVDHLEAGGDQPGANGIDLDADDIVFFEKQWKAFQKGFSVEFQTF